MSQRDSIPKPRVAKLPWVSPPGIAYANGVVEEGATSAGMESRWDMKRPTGEAKSV